MDASDYIKRQRQRMVSSDVIGKRTQFNEGRRAWVRIQGNSGNYESTYQAIEQGTVELTPAEYAEIVTDASVGEYKLTSAFDVLYNANTQQLTIIIPELNDPLFDTYNFYLVGSFDESQWGTMLKMTKAGPELSLTCTFHTNFPACKLFAYTSISSPTTAPPWSGNPNVDMYGGSFSENNQSYAVYHTIKPAPFDFDYFKNNSLDGIYLDNDMPIQITEGAIELNLSDGITIVGIHRDMNNKIVIEYSSSKDDNIAGSIIEDSMYSAVSTSLVGFLAHTTGSHTIQDDTNLIVGGLYRIVDLSQKDTTHFVYFFADLPAIPPLNP